MKYLKTRFYTKQLLHTKYKVVMLCLMSILSDFSLQAAEDLTMGVFPRRNSVVTVKMFTPLSRYLSEQLGVNVKLETAKNITAFWDGIVSKHYDIVHYNQLHYILSHKKIGYTVFAKNEEFGRSDFGSSIIVRKDSGIRTIADLKGKKIIFGGGEFAMIAYVGVKLILMENGLNDSDYISIFARNPPNSSLAVYFKKASAGGVGDIALSVPSVIKRINANELEYLASGHKQAHLPWALSPQVDPQLKDQIKTVFLTLSSSSKGLEVLKEAGLTGIQVAEDKDYDGSREIYQKFKLMQSLKK